MVDDPHDSVRKKVDSIFRELVGDRANSLRPDILPAQITTTIMRALSGPEATESEVLNADKVAFHLTDWNGDAAFLVALHLYPERFTDAEIEAGIGLFLSHAPSHVIAAARLSGWPATDLFNDEDPSVP